MLIAAQGAACWRILQGCCELCPSALRRRMAVAMAVLTTGIRSDLSIMRTDSINNLMLFHACSLWFIIGKIDKRSNCSKSFLSRILSRYVQSRRVECCATCTKLGMRRFPGAAVLMQRRNGARV